MKCWNEPTGICTRKFLHANSFFRRIHRWTLRMKRAYSTKNIRQNLVTLRIDSTVA